MRPDDDDEDEVEVIEEPTGRVYGRGTNKRVVERHCPICNRAHMCFATAADLEPEVLEKQAEVAIGSRFTLAYDTVGSWHGSKAKIRAGTSVVVKNLHTDNAGGLRAMVELDDGDVYWIPSQQLTRT